MKKIFFYLLVSFVIYAQDQDINQVTGATDIPAAKGANNKNEIDELKKEIRELKRQLAELKGVKPKEKQERLKKIQNHH
ncbi:MAG: hypothetical protein N3A69_02900 [Leptospiraceae bacterium]|nr:hypothetical protein [Leptospiraceae bacterium]